MVNQTTPSPKLKTWFFWVSFPILLMILSFIIVGPKKSLPKYAKYRYGKEFNPEKK